MFKQWLSVFVFSPFASGQTTPLLTNASLVSRLIISVNRTLLPVCSVGVSHHSLVPAGDTC